MNHLNIWAKAGFVFAPRHGARSILIAIAAGLALGAWIVLADSTVFAAAVPQSQHEIYKKPLAVLLPGLGLAVLIDELVLRLLALPLIVLALRRFGIASVWSAVLLTAWLFWPLYNYHYMSLLDGSLLAVTREAALHCVAGTLWGWLCWRHGWLAGLTGHLAAYGVIVPVLTG